MGGGWVSHMRARRQALPAGRAFFMYLILAGCAVCLVNPLFAATDDKMSDDEAKRLGEQFGIVVDSVDEEIRKELKMQRPEAVVVFEVIRSEERRVGKECRTQW